MRSTTSVLIGIFVLICSIESLYAGKFEIQDVKVKMKTKQEGDYTLHFKFEVPELPQHAVVDYAVLSFGVNVLDTTRTKTVEALFDGDQLESKATSFNLRPATEVISRKSDGLRSLDIDITKVVKLWYSGDVKNKGIKLISHREEVRKSLETKKIAFANEYKDAEVNIFYTVLEPILE